MRPAALSYPERETSMTSSRENDQQTTSRQPLIVIEASRGWNAFDFREMFEYRELLYFLIWRDIKVRYRQAALGAAWAIIQPLFALIVFSVFLGKFANVPSSGIPYPLFSYLALAPWTFFASGLGSAAGSVERSSQLITKVYFPRPLVPIAAVSATVLDFVLAQTVTVFLLIRYKVLPAATALPWWLFLTVVTAALACGLGFWLGALNVRYRDVRHALPFLTQIWMFLTPVVYPMDVVPERFRVFLYFNPMVGVVEGFRAAVLGRPMPIAAISISVGIALVLLVSGMLFFRRFEREFADEI